MAVRRPVVSKHRRLEEIFRYLVTMPAASTSLEAYKLLAEAIDHVEDKFLGAHTYKLKLTRKPLVNTRGRIYVPQLESIVPVPRYRGVHLLITAQHVTLLSRHGAIEVQHKLHEDKEGLIVHFEERHDQVLLQKPDFEGHGVWHPKNL